MPERLHAVLTVLYLVFTEGYAATRGEALIRTDLCAEAIRLARVVRALLGAGPPGEVSGVLALMLLHDARRHARVDAAGDLVVLEDQDRTPGITRRSPKACRSWTRPCARWPHIRCRRHRVEHRRAATTAATATPGQSPAAHDRCLPRGGPEPRRRRGDARWSRGRPAGARHAGGQRRAGGASAVLLVARGPVASRGPQRGRGSTTTGRRSRLRRTTEQVPGAAAAASHAAARRVRETVTPTAAPCVPRLPPQPRPEIAADPFAAVEQHGHAAELHGRRWPGRRWR